MHADYPSWSRDGKYIYFNSERNEAEEAIYRVSTASGKAEPVATLAGSPRAVDDLYGKWTGLAPDDSPTILRSADLQRIYLISFR